MAFNSMLPTRVGTGSKYFNILSYMTVPRYTCTYMYSSTAVPVLKKNLCTRAGSVYRYGHMATHGHILEYVHEYSVYPGTYIYCNSCTGPRVHWSIIQIIPVHVLCVWHIGHTGTRVRTRVHVYTCTGIDNVSMLV